MFMLSVRLSRKRMFIAAFALVLAVSGGVAWSSYAKHKDETVPTTTSAAGEATTTSDKKAEKTVKKKVDSKKAAAKTNEQRLAFIEAYGWEAESEPAEIMEIIIPKEFDEVYSEYNSLQKMQGFDLSSYSGKRAKRYSYAVVNYPGQTENVRINLIVHNNKIIGGDVCSLDSDGFMHGFEANNN